jgi:hypothetical protein
MRALSPIRCAAALALLAPLAGCGGSSAPTDTATQTAGRAAAAAPDAVSVLGSRVAVDPRRVTLALTLRQPADVDPPTARTATVTLRGDVAYHGGAGPTCAPDTLEREGATACPPASVIGTGAAVGIADTARTRAEITVLDGGPRTVLLATVIRHPVYTKAVVRGTVTADGDAGLRIAFAFPPDLQSIGGVPVGLQRLDLVLHRGAVVAVGPCPPATTPWRYAASVSFADQAVTRHAGAATCSGP